MANLSLQKFRPGSSTLPGSSFRPEPEKQDAELQIDTQILNEKLNFCS